MKPINAGVVVFLIFFMSLIWLEARLAPSNFILVINEDGAMSTKYKAEPGRYEVIVPGPDNNLTIMIDPRGATLLSGTPQAGRFEATFIDHPSPIPIIIVSLLIGVIAWAITPYIKAQEE